MTSDYLTNAQIVEAAYGNLPQDAWNYLTGGSETETTMRRNRAGFDRLAFRPRILIDVTKLDASTSFMGHHMRIPVMTAPIGTLEAFTPDGGAAVARATARFGTIPVISTSTMPSLEDTANASDGPKIFQLYVLGDRSWIRDILARVKESGYVGLALTVDVAVLSRRERSMLTGWIPATARYGGGDRAYRATLTWELMDFIKETAGLPFLLKGVQTAEDAALAVEHGVDVIWVSNHGGRQLDHQRGAIDILPEVVQAVNGRSDIVLDGGVTRGTDVLKALALGARAVAIGKLQGWGLGAAGEDGLVRVLELLENEILVSMGLLGVTSIDQMGPQYVCEAEPVTPAHEMSAWVNMPGGRLL